MSQINNVSQTQLSDIGLNPAETKKDKDTNKTDFLALFVAQLRNQNPMDPQKGEDFLAQLAQFSMVEGIKNMESSFKEFTANMQSSQALQASSLVGKNVEVKTGNFIYNQGDSVKGSVELAQSVADLKLEVINNAGQVVKTIAMGTKEAGFAPFVWNGLDDNGQELTPGMYKVKASSVIEGTETQLDTYVASNVDSVTINQQGRGLLLNVSGFGTVSIEDIRTIS